MMTQRSLLLALTRLLTVLCAVVMMSVSASDHHDGDDDDKANDDDAMQLVIHQSESALLHHADALAVWLEDMAEDHEGMASPPRHQVSVVIMMVNTSQL